MRNLLSLLGAVVVLVGCGGAGGEADPDGGGGPGPDGNVVTGNWAPDSNTDQFVQFIGRFDKSETGGPRFSWPGTTIKVRFVGSTLSMTLSDDLGTNLYDVVIDGKPASVLKPKLGLDTYVLASNLSPGQHDLALVRRTESFQGITRLVGISGSPLVQLPPVDRYIEIIGDSVSAGYGVLGTTSTCPYSADTQAEPQSWGALAAADLGVGHASIAYSGKGVYRNYVNTDPEPLPPLYGRSLADIPESVWTFKDYKPAVIVANLGTNDFIAGDPGKSFVNAYVDFLNDVRKNNRDAWIVVATPTLVHDEDPAGEMQRTKVIGYLNDVVKKLNTAGDSKVTFMDLLETDPSDGYGCSYHPTPVTHRKLADQLVAKVRELTGW